MNASEELLSHVRDLADRSYRQNIFTFTGFLTMSEQSDILSARSEFSYVPMKLFGGSDGCERKMLRFGSEEMFGYEEAFPISCITVRPASEKYADDLTHRDYLGALMSLGIERSIIGDIIVRDNTGYIFCESRMSQFLCESITSIKHTGVSCTYSDSCPQEVGPRFETEELNVSSERCDAVIAALYRLSRSRAAALFAGKCVFIDGRQCENSSTQLKDGAVVSVRGFGKFVYDGEMYETRKGRLRISVRRYI